MAELRPYPFAALVRRMHRELERQQAIFDLPAAKFFGGDSECDFSTELFGHRVSSPLGPAAGPQTQMAQNLVLSWLGGCRVMELKTVQIQDELAIPRPCIDMQTVGLNAEWSQELKLQESLEEYVKGAMLIEMLRHRLTPPRDGFGDVVYDLSVGYDLAGIRSRPVQAFIRGMQDASDVVERLRAEIPDEFRHLRDLDYPVKLSDTLTLSTFHGCPPNEIESIIEFLLRENGLHCVVKFNPMLLGRDRAHELLYEVLGYHDLEVPDSAFERDTTWPQAVEMMERLGASALEVGLGLGAKFSNTLIVKNTRGFLAEGEDEVYLSGEPLHVLAMNLVRRFRRQFGSSFPISFSAGIDRDNYPDAVALGLVPITVCTDLLRKGGYGRLRLYHAELRRRMDICGARSLGDFVLRAFGHAGQALQATGVEPGHPAVERCRDALLENTDLRAAAGDDIYERWLSQAVLLNTRHYVETATHDPRYHRDQNLELPRKIGSHLELFDCITCDICVPVCPNDANFTFGSDQREIPVVKAVRRGDGWEWRHERDIELGQRHQIANFADFCNDCGNCDIFCPEDGGPYVIKPRFFGSEDEWQAWAEHDGFFVERSTAGDRVLARFDGTEYRLETRGSQLTYSGDGFELSFDPSDPVGTLASPAGDDRPREIDVTFCHLMDYVRRSLLDSERVNYVNSLYH